MERPRLTFLIGAYQRPDHLRVLLNCLRVQSNPHWQAIVAYESIDGVPWNEIVERPDPRIVARDAGPYAGDWHQSARAKMVAYAEGEWLAFPADDAYYAPTFVQQMVGHGEAHGWDLAYCDWLYDAAGYVAWQGCPEVGRIDVGGFIVRRTTYDAVDGWPFRDHEGDGKFVRRVIEAGHAHGRVPHVVYVKN